VISNKRSAQYSPDDASPPFESGLNDGHEDPEDTRVPIGMRSQIHSNIRGGLPILEALKFGCEDLKARSTRTKLSAVSIVLSIAFMVYLSTTTSILQVVTGQRQTVETHHYLLELIALLVCFAGIANTMLISVGERFREIGTMKCLGAKDRHVVMMFLFEALVLGIAGGVAGGLLGVSAGLVTNGIQHGLSVILSVPMSDHLWNFGSGLLTALALTETGSLYPAYYVARLSPAEALRHEL